MKKVKRLLIFVFCIAIVLGCATIAYAKIFLPEYPTNLPEMDPSKISIPISDVQPFSEAETELTAKDAEPAKTKQEIYDRMLNSVDFFDTVTVCFDLKIAADDPAVTCEIDTNLITGETYEASTPLDAGANRVNRSLASIERYSDGEYVTDYFNDDKTYRIVQSVEPRLFSEQEIPEGQPRAFMGSNDRQPSYIYRDDPTNSVWGSFCLFPQGLTFGYLTDFDLWDIEGTETYLDRECLILSGQSNGSYKRKTGVNTFTMYVDSQTGILLKQIGFNEKGEVVRYLTVNSISIDGPTTYATSRHDMSKYADYTKLDS